MLEDWGGVGLPETGCLALGVPEPEPVAKPELIFPPKPQLAEAVLEGAGGSGFEATPLRRDPVSWLNVRLFPKQRSRLCLSWCRLKQPPAAKCVLNKAIHFPQPSSMCFLSGENNNCKGGGRV